MKNSWFFVHFVKFFFFLNLRAHSHVPLLADLAYAKKISIVYRLKLKDILVFFFFSTTFSILIAKMSVQGGWKNVETA